MLSARSIGSLNSLGRPATATGPAVQSAPKMEPPDPSVIYSGPRQGYEQDVPAAQTQTPAAQSVVRVPIEPSAPIMQESFAPSSSLLSSSADSDAAASAPPPLAPAPAPAPAPALSFSNTQLIISGTLVAAIAVTAFFLFRSK